MNKKAVLQMDKRDFMALVSIGTIELN